MFARFSLLAVPEEFTGRFCDWTPSFEFEPSYNAAPLQEFPLKGSDFFDLFPWGYKKADGKQEILLPVESLMEGGGNKSFIPCLLPFTSFFLWKVEVVRVPIGFGEHKQVAENEAYLFKRPGNQIMAFAALYLPCGPKGGEPCFLLLSCPSRAGMKDISARIPMIVDPLDDEKWLNEFDPGVLKSVEACNWVKSRVGNAVFSPNNNSEVVFSAP